MYICWNVLHEHSFMFMLIHLCTYYHLFVYVCIWKYIIYALYVQACISIYALIFYFWIIYNFNLYIIYSFYFTRKHVCTHLLLSVCEESTRAWECFYEHIIHSMHNNWIYVHAPMIWTIVEMKPILILYI